MEEAAAVRKARINALRRLKQADEAGEWDTIRSDEALLAVRQGFRSYRPAPSDKVVPEDTLEAGGLVPPLRH